MRIGLPNAKRLIRGIVKIAVALVLSACVERPPELHYGMVDPPPIWSVRLQAIAKDEAATEPDGRAAIAGLAMMLPGPRMSETTVQVAVVNAIPGQQHAWHIHHGACESGGKIAGPSSEYPPLVASGSGKAGVRALLPFTVPTSGRFHIDVHASLTSTAVIACGDLNRAH
jgi:hypothetical protein